jgi:DNA-binding protein HU-beta
VHAKSSAGLGASGGTRNVNRADLIDTVAARVGISKQQAGEAVHTVTDEITRAVSKGQKVALTGFGVFEKADRRARTGRNPQTGEAVKIRKTSVPKFRPGAQFKGVVSGAVKLGKAVDPRTRSTAARSTGGTASSSSKTAAKSSTGRTSGARKSTGSKSTAKKSAGTRSTAKKSTGARSTAKKITARKS